MKCFSSVSFITAYARHSQNITRLGPVFILISWLGSFWAIPVGQFEKTNSFVELFPGFKFSGKTSFPQRVPSTFSCHLAVLVRKFFFWSIFSYFLTGYIINVRKLCVNSWCLIFWFLLIITVLTMFLSFKFIFYVVGVVHVHVKVSHYI